MGHLDRFDATRRKIFAQNCEGLIGRERRCRYFSFTSSVRRLCCVEGEILILGPRLSVESELIVRIFAVQSHFFGVENDLIVLQDGLVDRLERVGRFVDGVTHRSPIVFEASGVPRKAQFSSA